MRPYTFWRSFLNTLTNPKYYVDVLNAKLRFSLRFTLISYVVMSLLAVVLFSFIDVPKLQTALGSYIDQVVADFPTNQEVSWNGLRLQLSEPEPYALAFPQLPDLQGTPPNLVEINPAVEMAAQISQTSDNKSAFFANQTQLFVSQPGGGWSGTPLTDFLSSSPFVINKQTLVAQQPQLQQQLATGLRLLPLAFLAFFLLVSFPLRMLNVIFDTIFIYVVIRIFGLPMSFKKVVQVSLHVSVAAELITILTANFAAGLPMFTIAFWGYTLIIYWQLRHVKALTLSEVERLNKES